VLIGSRPKEFQRTITERGVYYICFDLPESPSTINNTLVLSCYILTFCFIYLVKETIRAFFHVDAKSRAAQAMEQAQKLGKSDLSALEIQLKSAEDLLNEISKEIDFSRRQEMILVEANGKPDTSQTQSLDLSLTPCFTLFIEAMTTRIHRFGYLSIGILAFSSLWQLIYLRRFFISKKLL
jgi:hypothetical protein